MILLHKSGDGSRCPNLSGASLTLGQDLAQLALCTRLLAIAQHV